MSSPVSNDEFGLITPPPIDKVRVGQIAEKAAAIIEEKGWTKRKLEDFQTGSVCAVGAIRTAIFGQPEMDREHPDYEAQRGDAAMFEQGFFPWFDKQHPDVPRFLGVPSLPEWNDAPERTREDVVAEFRTFAAEIQGDAS